MPERGELIVIEGGEGCGKTTQSELLRDYLKEKGYDCFLSKETGEVPSAEAMRKILKNKEYDITPIGELFGFNLARAEFYDKVAIPKLKEGHVVILDRSVWSTEAYQGHAGGVDLNMIRYMNEISTQGVSPSLGIIIDIDPITGLEREIESDRISAKGLEYHQKARAGFLEIARENPERVVVVPYRSGDVEGMQDEIRRHVKERLPLG